MLFVVPPCLVETHWRAGPDQKGPATNGGGDEGTRTPGLLNAIEALSHLSYIPTKWTLPTCERYNGRHPSAASPPELHRGNLQASSAYRRSLWALLPGSHLCSTRLSARDGLLLLVTSFALFESSITCGAEGIRTPGLISAIDALSQLSYSPTCGTKYRAIQPVCQIAPSPSGDIII